MTELSEEKKKTIWTKLAAVLGVSLADEKPEVVLADENEEETPTEPSEIEVLQAENEALKADNEILKAENEALKAELETLRGETAESKEVVEALKAELSKIESEPADKKINLSTEPVALSPAQARLQQLRAMRN